MPAAWRALSLVPPQPHRGAGRDGAHASPPGRGALRALLPTSDRAPPLPAASTGSIAPPAGQRVLSDPCVPGPEQGAGTTGPDVAYPRGAPSWGAGQKSRSRPCGQSISVLISQALGGATWVPGWGSLGQPVRVRPGHLPPTAPASLPVQALLLAGPWVAWSLKSAGLRPFPEPSALIYVLLRWGIFSKNRTDVRKTTPPGNHAYRWVSWLVSAE